MDDVILQLQWLAYAENLHGLLTCLPAGPSRPGSQEPNGSEWQVYQVMVIFMTSATCVHRSGCRV